MHNFCYNGQYILHGLSWSLSPPYLCTHGLVRLYKISLFVNSYIYKQKPQITWKFLNVKNVEWIITHINKKILHTLNVTCMFFLAWYAWLLFQWENVSEYSALFDSNFYRNTTNTSKYILAWVCGFFKFMRKDVVNFKINRQFLFFEEIRKYFISVVELNTYYFLYKYLEYLNCITFKSNVVKKYFF